MPRPRQQRQLSRNALAAFLVLALLFAQWAGVIHRVVHAERMAAPAKIVSAVKVFVGQAPPLNQSESTNQDKHSCAAFDAATLGASLPMPFACLPVLPGAAVLALWSAFISWEPPLTHFYSSRAPPLV